MLTAVRQISKARSSADPGRSKTAPPDEDPKDADDADDSADAKYLEDLRDPKARS
ncbi:hypothetical protein AB0I66_17695 [Streptomyces sp. NPDC050439]|uniref:hypothetical protein n=1 Tax=unclassified Streptomyces TaxID=2593676 RepID=UPI003415F9A9